MQNKWRFVGGRVRDLGSSVKMEDRKRKIKRIGRNGWAEGFWFSEKSSVKVVKMRWGEEFYKKLDKTLIEVVWELYRGLHRGLHRNPPIGSVRVPYPHPILLSRWHIRRQNVGYQNYSIPLSSLFMPIPDKITDPMTIFSTQNIRLWKFMDDFRFY